LYAVPGYGLWSKSLGIFQMLQSKTYYILLCVAYSYGLAFIFVPLST
jgi:hypothetical protein